MERSLDKALEKAGSLVLDVQLYSCQVLQTTPRQRRPQLPFARDEGTSIQLALLDPYLKVRILSNRTHTHTHTRSACRVPNALPAGYLLPHMPKVPSFLCAWAVHGWYPGSISVQNTQAACYASPRGPISPSSGDEVGELARPESVSSLSSGESMLHAATCPVQDFVCSGHLKALSKQLLKYVTNQHSHTWLVRAMEPFPWRSQCLQSGIPTTSPPCPVGPR